MKRWRYTIRSRPICTPPMFRVTGVLDRDGFRFDPNQDLPASWDGCDVRCTYRFQKSIAGEIDRSVVEAAFLGARHVRCEPVCESDRAVRAPELAAAVTLADKARVWAALNQVVVTDRLLDKLARLKRQDGAELLSEVARELAADTDTAPQRNDHTAPDESPRPTGLFQ